MSEQAQDSKILVTTNYRPGATFPWLVRLDGEHPEEATVHKNLVLMGVELRPSASYGEGLGEGPMAICDKVLSFDPQLGLPEMMVLDTNIRSEMFGGPWAMVSIDTNTVPASSHPDFKEVELEYNGTGFTPKGGGESITMCAALTLFEDRTAKALIHTPPQRQPLDRVLDAIFDGWPFGRR